MTDDLIEFISYFYTLATKEIKVKAIYSEMNGFIINYDQLVLHLFAFKTCEGIGDTE